MAKLVLFPAKSGSKHVTKDVAPAADRAAAVQLKGPIMPFASRPAAGPAVFVALTPELTGRSAYRTLRQERTNAKLKGRREKKAKELAAAPVTKPKEDAAE